MKKCCKRKHYDTSFSPLDYVLNGMKPVSSTSPITTVRIKNHSAMQAAVMGKADFNDIDTLVAAWNMAEALAHLGVGVEYLEEIRQANVSMTCMQLRGGLTGPEIKALQMAMEIHEAQLDDSRATVALVEEAMQIVKKVIRIKKQQRAREKA